MIKHRQRKNIVSVEKKKEPMKMKTCLAHKTRPAVVWDGHVHPTLMLKPIKAGWCETCDLMCQIELFLESRYNCPTRCCGHITRYR